MGPCIGPYTLIREMGSGGMGTVRLVQQKSIEGTDVKTREAAREELARIRAAWLRPDNHLCKASDVLIESDPHAFAAPGPKRSMIGGRRG